MDIEKQIYWLFRCDIFIEDKNVGIEYDGFYFHKELLHKDEIKSKALEDYIKLIRVREKGLNEIEAFGGLVIKRKHNYSNEDLEDCIRKILKYIQLNFVLDKETTQKIEELDIDVIRDIDNIYDLMIFQEKENSLLTLYPEVSDKWHPSQNGTLTPAKVSYSSAKKVLWKCASGHEWMAQIANMSRRGDHCPYCANKKVCDDNCLGNLRPDLVKEWHPDKNKISPFEVTIGSTVKAWWVCEKGHDWNAKIRVRVQGTACPYCAGKSVSSDNCLATLNPNLVKEWHTSKNDQLTPYHVTGNSNKKVWWICKNGHTWRATVSSRFNGSACPYCLVD